MIHRLIAIFGGTMLIIMSWIWIKKKCGYQIIGKSIVFLLFFEIIIGILNVIFRVQTFISTMHTAVAATLTGLLFLAVAEFIIDNEKS